MPRRSVSAQDAEKYRRLVLDKFRVFIENDLYGEPKVIEDWDGAGHYAVCWDGPYDWALYAGGDMPNEVREAEFGIRLPAVPVPASLSHVFAEPYDGYTLVLYLDA